LAAAADCGRHETRPNLYTAWNRPRFPGNAAAGEFLMDSVVCPTAAATVDLTAFAGIARDPAKS